MKRAIQAMALFMVGIAGGVAMAQVPTQNTQAVEKPRPVLQRMPESLEIQFALSALPPSLRDKASVYVLDPSKGFILIRARSDEQSCFVDRTEWKFEEYRDDIFEPMCYDAAGSKSQMRVRFDVAELRAQGLSPEALKKEIEKRFSDGRYKPPDRAGFSYMTAPLMRTYMSLDPRDKTVMTMPMPHIMYYAPNATDAEVGGIPPLSPYPFVFEPGPLGYIIQRLGDNEAAKIVANESALVKDLCTYRSSLCLSAGAPGNPPSQHSR